MIYRFSFLHLIAFIFFFIHICMTFSASKYKKGPWAVSVKHVWTVHDYFSFTYINSY